MKCLIFTPLDLLFYLHCDQSVADRARLFDVTCNSITFLPLDHQPSEALIYRPLRCIFSERLEPNVLLQWSQLMVSLFRNRVTLRLLCCVRAVVGCTAARCTSYSVKYLETKLDKAENANFCAKYLKEFPQIPQLYVRLTISGCLL